MRRFFLGGIILLSLHAPAQTLFTYGKDSVSVKDFLHAYNKNNTAVKNSKALQEYLDLYIASRLKIKEALVRGYDTLPQLVSDIDNLRTQILPNYEKDTEALEKLVDEALTRAQKDIHLAHIFISYNNLIGQPDSAKAKEKALKAYNALKINADFKTIAAQYSDDTSAKYNGGDLGYITVFTLPYELENIAYRTPAGSISTLYQSHAGYHIFKNLGERKALGRIKAAQILIAFPPNTTEIQKKGLKKLTDSLYTRLLKGDNFGKLAAQFSNDYVSAQANGTIPEFGVGQYAPVFENTILSLKNGAISKPFETDYGYHIVKRIAITPVGAKTDTKLRQAIKEKIEQDERINITKDILVQKVRKMAQYQRLPFDEKQLWAFSDSVFSNLTPTVAIRINPSTPLLKFGNDNATVTDWINYAQVSRYKTDGTGTKTYGQVWNEFINASALEYYRNHLEDFNPVFHDQMKEFREGNLFFEIMQKEIWGPAQTDTVALQAYFQKNKTRYNWGKSVDAVIFYTSDITVAQLLSAQLKRVPSSWQEFVNNMQDKVSADSGRFELKQIPNAVNTELKEGMITTPLVNKSDNTASFAYIRKIYTQPAPRSFEEAKGLVINDYQAELEREWINDLKKKYPVTVNQNTLAELMNTAKR
jgi:peptidyl-prolyl cis-trans isomerase SurA